MKEGARSEQRDLPVWSSDKQKHGATLEKKELQKQRAGLLLSRVSRTNMQHFKFISFSIKKLRPDTEKKNNIKVIFKLDLIFHFKTIL